jgi:hypothetical protein
MNGVISVTSYRCRTRALVAPAPAAIYEKHTRTNAKRRAKRSAEVGWIRKAQIIRKRGKIAGTIVQPGAGSGEPQCEAIPVQRRSRARAEPAREMKRRQPGITGQVG